MAESSEGEAEVQNVLHFDHVIEGSEEEKNHGNHEQLWYIEPKSNGISVDELLTVAAVLGEANIKSAYQ